MQLETGRQAVVPLASVTGVVGLPARASAARTARRFALGYALRGLSRDRAPVAVTDTSGQVLTGTIDVVGADSLDLAEHALGESRRPENVTGRQTVPFRARRARRVALSRRLSPRPGLRTKSRVWEYIRWMYSSSTVVSTRHWPRPPTLIAGSSPDRTSA